MRLRVRWGWGGQGQPNDVLTIIAMLTAVVADDGESTGPCEVAPISTFLCCEATNGRGHIPQGKTASLVNIFLIAWQGDRLGPLRTRVRLVGLHGRWQRRRASARLHVPIDL